MFVLYLGLFTATLFRSRLLTHDIIVSPHEASRENLYGDSRFTTMQSDLCTGIATSIDTRQQNRYSNELEVGLRL